jgi:hypothetical protein
MRFPSVRSAGLLLCSIMIGCTGETDPGMSALSGQNAVAGTGTIQFMSIEGGFYVIRSDDGTVYDAQNLPDEFRVDGLRVRFLVRILPQAIGVHMVGPIVRVLHIERSP